MSWPWSKKETDESKETKETNESRNDEFDDSFRKSIEVDSNGKYKYKETPEDQTKKQDVEKNKKADTTDDEEANKNRDYPTRNLDDDDDGR